MFLVAIVCLLFLALVQAQPLDNGRSLSWSGWTPGSGMSLFTSSDDPWGAQESLWGARGTVPWGGQAVSPWGGRQLSPSLWGHRQSSPPHWDRQGGAAPLWRRQAEGATAASHPAAAPSLESRDQFDELDHEKQPARPSRPHYGSKEDDEEVERKSPGSNANASFNAWFPILLGRYPGGEERTRGGGSSEEGPNNERGLAAIANSVNHGRSGAASSHAVIYSGLPPPPLTSRQRKSQEPSYY